MFCLVAYDMIYQVKKKGHEALIQVDNPNRAKPKTLKARDLDVSKLSLCFSEFSKCYICI